MEPPSDEVLEHSRTEMITALVARYGDQLADDEITAIATAAWDQLRREAQVATYLPLLTRRTAEDRIRSRLRSAI
jgi:hypothetical protein